jgi:hypothetical protein
MRQQHLHLEDLLVQACLKTKHLQQTVSLQPGVCQQWGEDSYSKHHYSIFLECGGRGWELWFFGGFACAVEISGTLGYSIDREYELIEVFAKLYES